MGDKAPYGAYPIMEIGGVYMGQSMSLCRYAAKLAGIYPTDPVQACRVDQVCDGVEESIQKLGRSMRVGRCPEHKGKTEEQQEAIKMTIRKGLAEEVYPKYLKQVDKLLGDNEYFVGNSVTPADLTVA